MVYKLYRLKRLCHLSILVILLLMFTVFQLTESMCGKPGLSENCEYNRNSLDQYEVGHTVTYYCRNNPCYTTNSMHRECLENGTWSGKIPFCHRRAIENVNQVLLVNGTSKIIDNSTMDRQNSTCVSIDSSTHWEAVLTKPFRVIAVRTILSGRTGISTNVWAQVQNGNTNYSCGRILRGTDSKNFQQFTCNGDTGNKIKIFPIIMTTKAEICEVQLFLQSNYACLRPDSPYQSRGHKSFHLTYTFTCNEGYEAVGDDTVLCQEDGTWTRSSFKCQKSTGCGKLPEVGNGVLRYNSTAINGTVWLECNEGFRPLSDNEAHCLPSGSWSTSSFNCEWIKCDPYPVVPHGKAELPNGFAYGSKLHITCDRGYMAVEPKLRECHKNGSWENLNICTQTICGSLKFEVTEAGQWLSLNETISIRVLMCQTGYHIEGSPAVTQCLPNGSWSYTTAVCRKNLNCEIWNNDWTPSTVLFSAIAVGAGTAICILCLAMCFLVVKKRRQKIPNSSIFHVGVTDSILYNERSKEQQNHKANTYEDVIELRNNPSNTNPRKPSSALPHLPIFTVDTDPVYAQPFETTNAYSKTMSPNTSADIYTAHIYAEPVDSHRPPSGPSTFTSAAETWLRSGAKKFGRKMSLPGRASLPEDSVAQLGKNMDPVHKPAYESSNASSLSTRFDEKQKIIDYEPKMQTTFSELINNSIYLDTKEGRFSSKRDSEQLQMIDNDIYQDDYFSSV